MAAVARRSGIDARDDRVAAQRSDGRMRLVTGHPRSGTHFTAKLLRRMGYPTSCEGKRLRRGQTRFVSSWKHARPGVFEFRFSSVPIETGFGRVLHQVRHPLAVIASSTTLSHLTTNHIKKYLDIPEPSIRRHQPLGLCMRSWIGWNRIIEAQADWRFKLEELPEVFPEFCRQLDIPVQPMPRMGKKNARRHPTLTWDDLYAEDEALAEEIRAMAIAYGYDD